MGTSNARNKNLRPLFNTNIPPISGKYGLRNHFWSLESGFLMRKREENDFFSKSAKDPILSFWILNVHIIICQFQKRSTVKDFFSLSPCSCHMCNGSPSDPSLSLCTCVLLQSSVVKVIHLCPLQEGLKNSSIETCMESGRAIVDPVESFTNVSACLRSCHSLHLDINVTCSDLPTSGRPSKG